jgi:DNA-binding transcriptional MocR family regulator
MQAILPSTLTNFPKSSLALYETIRPIIRQKALDGNLSPVEVRVSQRELREKTGLSHDVIKWNMRKLVEYEFVKSVGNARNGGKKLYSLVEDASFEPGGYFCDPIPRRDGRETPEDPKRGKPG